MGLTEVDLVKIRTALEKPSLSEALEAMGKVLSELGEQKRLDRPDREKIIEECMPTLERFEVVEKQVFFPIPCPPEFSATIRIYASTMSREAVRKSLALIPDELAYNPDYLDFQKGVEATRKIWKVKVEELKETITYLEEAIQVMPECLEEEAKCEERERILGIFEKYKEPIEKQERLNTKFKMANTVWQALKETEGGKQC